MARRNYMRRTPHCCFEKQKEAERDELTREKRKREPLHNACATPYIEHTFYHCSFYIIIIIFLLSLLIALPNVRTSKYLTFFLGVLSTERRQSLPLRQNLRHSATPSASDARRLLNLQLSYDRVVKLIFVQIKTMWTISPSLAVSSLSYMIQQSASVSSI